LTIWRCLITMLLKARGKMSEKGTSEESAQTSTRSLRRRFNKTWLIILALVVIVIASILAYNSHASAPVASSSSYHNTGGTKIPNLSLVPATEKVPLSSGLSIKIWANTGGQKVNAVETNLSYPIDKLNFVSVDSTASAFGLSVQGYDCPRQLPAGIRQTAGGNGQLYRCQHQRPGNCQLCYRNSFT
jgi:hypothetical protein